jgi:hypothetical protein
MPAQVQAVLPKPNANAPIAAAAIASNGDGDPAALSRPAGAINVRCASR